MHFGKGGQREAVRRLPYTLFKLSVSQKRLEQHLTLFAALDDIFDADYQEILGYNTFGRNFYAGLAYRF